MMTKFTPHIGHLLTIIFSLGAMIGATITMNAAVANRTAEIGTLRALGFQRRNILLAFLVESMLMSVTGGCLGLFFASFMQLFTVSTVNWQTFSRTRIFVYLDRRDYLQGHNLFSPYGIHRRLPSGLQGVQNEYCRCPENTLTVFHKTFHSNLDQQVGTLHLSDKHLVRLVTKKGSAVISPFSAINSLQTF